MKHFFFLLSLLAMFSCAKEQIEVTDAQMPEALQQKMKTHIVIDVAEAHESAFLRQSDGGCQTGTCLQAVQKLQALYQAFANINCITLWAEVKCCVNGKEVSIIVLVRPNIRKCYRFNSVYSELSVVE